MHSKCINNSLARFIDTLKKIDSYSKQYKFATSFEGEIIRHKFCLHASTNKIFCEYCEMIFL